MSESEENDYFIQNAIKHKGSLHRWAAEHGFLNKDGTINLQEAKAYAKKHKEKHRLRQINLAHTLGLLRR